jgi:hypothetical protein
VQVGFAQVGSRIAQVGSRIAQVGITQVGKKTRTAPDVSGRRKGPYAPSVEERLSEKVFEAYPSESFRTASEEEFSGVSAVFVLTTSLTGTRLAPYPNVRTSLTEGCS